MRRSLALVAVFVVLVAWGLEQTRAERHAVTRGAVRLNEALDDTAKKQEKPSPPKGVPLLLDDDEAETKPSKRPGADNSRCFVCHLNYQTETIATTHARANIGCAKCHGASDAHIADESWASGGKGTAPDIMYPSAKVNGLCTTCHDMEKDDIKNKCKFHRLPESEKKVCTDCHGKHRLASRKCKWK